jgi:hypothetical protein
VTGVTNLEFSSRGLLTNQVSEGYGSLFSPA